MGVVSQGQDSSPDSALPSTKKNNADAGGSTIALPGLRPDELKMLTDEQADGHTSRCNDIKITDKTIMSQRQGPTGKQDTATSKSNTTNERNEKEKTTSHTLYGQATKN